MFGRQHRSGCTLHPVLYTTLPFSCRRLSSLHQDPKPFLKRRMPCRLIRGSGLLAGFTFTETVWTVDWDPHALDSVQFNMTYAGDSWQETVSQLEEALVAAEAPKMAAAGQHVHILKTTCQAAGGQTVGLHDHAPRIELLICHTLEAVPAQYAEAACNYGSVCVWQEAYFGCHEQGAACSGCDRACQRCRDGTRGVLEALQGRLAGGLLPRPLSAAAHSMVCAPFELLLTPNRTGASTASHGGKECCWMASARVQPVQAAAPVVASVNKCSIELDAAGAPVCQRRECTPEERQQLWQNHDKRLAREAQQRRLRRAEACWQQMAQVWCGVGRAGHAAASCVRKGLWNTALVATYPAACFSVAYEGTVQFEVGLRRNHSLSVSRPQQ